jgi:DNA polymerase-3 subunit gamma/tau
VSYLVLARKYRPECFDDLVGQEHVARTLRNALAADRVAHAYLFCGPRGVGKTSTARILAKAVNCLQSPGPEPCLKCEACRAIARGSDVDVLEIDAASNRRVEEVQPLIESSRYLPQRSARKVFIVDEAHMLSAHAFNALLKTLEEPPPHVLFLLATTAPHKIPETVRSRCHRFDLRRITPEDIVGKLERIADAEERGLADGVLAEMARRALGGLRDAESLLDQLLAAVPPERAVTLEDLIQVVGGVPLDLRRRILELAHAGDMEHVLEAAERAVGSGADPRELLEDLQTDLRDAAVAVVQGGGETEAGACGPGVEWCLAAAEIVGRHLRLATRSRAARASLDLALLALARLGDVRDLEDLVARLEGLAGGAPSPGPSVVEIPRPPPSPSAPEAPTASGTASVLDELRAQVPPDVGALLRTVRCREEGDLLVLEVPPGFALDRLRGAVGELRRASGRPLEVRAAAPRDPAPGSARERTLSPEEVARIRAHPSVRAVLDAFGGRVEQVRPDPGSAPPSGGS